MRPDLKNGWANPEYIINDVIAEGYEGKFENSIKDKRYQIQQLIKQYNNEFPKNKISSEYAIHFDLTGGKISENLARKINGELKQGENLIFIVIEYEGKTILLRKEDSFEMILNKINDLKSKKG